MKKIGFYIILISFVVYISYFHRSAQEQVIDESLGTKENSLINQGNDRDIRKVIIEKTTKENEDIVSKISGNIIGTELGKPGRKPETKELKFFHEVYLFDLEIGSGASFEQYFRWSENTEVKGIVQKLEELGLKDLAGTTKKAITVAFPDGIPDDNKKYHELTAWTEEQEEKLMKLYQEIEHCHGVVYNRLAHYAKEKELTKMERFSELF